MPSAWIEHVKKVYAAKKKKDASYKYSQAMKDAKATYTKKGAAKAPAKKKGGRKKKPKKAEEAEEEKVGGSLRRKVKKKKTMKILKM